MVDGLLLAIGGDALALVAVVNALHALGEIGWSDVQEGIELSGEGVLMSVLRRGPTAVST